MGPEQGRAWCFCLWVKFQRSVFTRRSKGGSFSWTAFVSLHLFYACLLPQCKDSISPSWREKQISHAVWERLAPLAHRLECLVNWEQALLEGVALLEKVWPCWGEFVTVGWASRFQKLKPSQACLKLFLLPATSPAPCLPARCHPSHHDDHGLN